MPTDEDRAKIDAWVAAAPETRVVESARDGRRWVSQALEDGEIRYEEIDLGGDEPLLDLLAGWCERQTKRFEPRPPVKTSGTSLPFAKKAPKL